jgi:hypothetical protein
VAFPWLDVHQQVQGPIGAAIRDLDGQRFLPPAQRRAIRHSPVQVGQLQQASHHSRRLPEWQIEQNLDRQTELDRGIREHRRATGPPSGGASQVISFPNQISRAPRFFSEAV